MLAWTIEIVPQRGTGQDRAAVIELDGGLVIALADGAGGTSNGALAAQTVVDAVGAAASMAPSWEDVLERCDHQLLDQGQTTAIALSIIDGVIHGASVGDSGAWLVGGASVDDLTRHQLRKPLVGSGGVAAFFRATLLPEHTLLVASDGLLRYARPADIARLATGPDLAAAARALVDLVRLPDGSLQDDVSFVLCRHVPS